MRPFYFMVVVWGERFQDYLLEKCIPSLLSPGNIPALEGGGHKFLIAMPFIERPRLESHPNWQRLIQYVEPVFTHIEHGPYDKAACKWMGTGHAKLTTIAHNDRAYGVLLTPDMMISDGAIRRCQSLARDGVEVVWTAALRFSETPLYIALDGVQLDRDLSPRALARAALRSFHTETRHCEWDGAGFYQSSPAAWWRAPSGVVLHTLSWNSLLIDYGAVPDHDISTMEKWTIDGDYIWKNFGARARLHLVLDSDEMIQVSWTPENPPPDVDDGGKRHTRIRRHQAWIESPKNPDNKDSAVHKNKNGYTFAQNYFGSDAWFHSMTFDPIKRRAFWRPVYWHSSDITPEWNDIELAARRTLTKALKCGSVHPDDASDPMFKLNEKESTHAEA